jgi:predicted kinase
MIIIVFGLPGTGKSFFASRLAEKLKVQYISSDDVRIAIKAKGKYTFEDKLSVYHEMAKQTDQSLREKKTVIVDGTFYRHEMRDLFVSLAKIHRTEIRFIEITANEKTIKERLKQSRKKSEANFEVYQLIKKQFESLDMPRFKIQSDNNNIEKTLLDALNYLKDADA